MVTFKERQMGWTGNGVNATNIIDTRTKEGKHRQYREDQGRRLDAMMDANKRGEPGARRERPPLPNWYSKERFGYTRKDNLKNNFDYKYWKGEQFKPLPKRNP